MSQEPEEVRTALEQFRAAPTSTADAVAKQLLKRLRSSDNEALLVCRLLSGHEPPQFGGASFAELMNALGQKERTGGELGSAARVAARRFVTQGVDQDYLQKKENEIVPGATGIFRRVLSVGGRVWVWVTLSMGAALAGAVASTDPRLSSASAVAFCVLLVLVIAVDAFRRRCPSCKRKLAGQLTSIVGDGSYLTVNVVTSHQANVHEVSIHKHNWRCVFCGNKWST